MLNYITPEMFTEERYQVGLLNFILSFVFLSFDRYHRKFINSLLYFLAAKPHLHITLFAWKPDPFLRFKTYFIYQGADGRRNPCNHCQHQQWQDYEDPLERLLRLFTRPQKSSRYFIFQFLFSFSLNVIKEDSSDW